MCEPTLKLLGQELFGPFYFFDLERTQIVLVEGSCPDRGFRARGVGRRKSALALRVETLVLSTTSPYATL